MATKRIGKKILKVAGIILGSLLLLLMAFHLWVVNHAEEIMEDLVASESHGKLALDVKNFKFRWFSKKMELEDAVFYTTDTVTAGTSYRFAVKNIKLNVGSIFPIIFEKKILINDLDLKDPEITVIRLRPSKDSTRSNNSSVPQEMGRIYKSIQDALQVLQVKKFEIENARFTLINRIIPSQLPINISKIDFHIDNLKVDTGKLTGKEKIFFSDNIILKSREQHIVFPDGRHQLAFRKFRINIEKKIVEFDSCTIAAVKTGNASNTFSIYFDRLVMNNIDFDTLYKAEVIKADSVYCINPKFDLFVDIVQKNNKNTAPPKLDKIIRQLTGNLLLKVVVVNNASFNINTRRNGKPSSFTSRGNNFEMNGLSIDDDATQPLQVDRFVMAIRNYENFLRDSQYSLQFDSIMVNNDKILLNNFTFRQRFNGRMTNTFKVPHFQLTGLSWDDLLFQQKLTARQATLFNPHIDFTEPIKKNTGNVNRNIFDILAEMNQVIMLEDLTILNGDIDMHLNGDIGMQLKDATLSVQSRALLKSSQLSGIRRSVNHLDFSQGTFRIKDMNVTLHDIYYTGNDSRLNAGSVTIDNDSKTIHAVAKGVNLSQIIINETTGDVSIDSMHWKEADINLTGLFTKRSQSGKGSFIGLTDIDGTNTRFTSSVNGKNIIVYLDHVSANSFLLKPGEKPTITGLSVAGNDFSLTDNFSKLHIASFSIADKENAKATGISYHKQTNADTVDITLPQFSFTPDIQAVINGEINTGDIRIVKPVINIILGKKENRTATSPLFFPTIRASNLSLQQPKISFVQKTKTGVNSIIWNGNQTADNSLVISGVTTSKNMISAEQASVFFNHFMYQNDKGKSFKAGEAEVTASLSGIRIDKPKDSALHWQATITDLVGKKFRFDSIGKKNAVLNIKTAELKNFSLNSSWLPNIRKIIAANTAFRFAKITGSFTDSNNHLAWNNAAYDKGQQLFTLDSFSFNPVKEREAFIASRKWQSDYIQMKSGAIHIGSFDIDRYLQDSEIRAGIVKIDDVIFSDYRDNRIAFQHGIIKKLMVRQIKSIPFKFSIDSLLLNSKEIVYSEFNPKTNQAGTIPLTRLSFKVFPVRNFNFIENDSLQIHATAYLMDSVRIRLRLKESYIDSHSGFLMTVQINQGDMRILNPVLGPLVSAQLRSGFLDTLSMRVVGNEYLAYGEMEMRYRNLKIDLLKNGVNTKRGFLSFIANSLLIRNKNSKRTGYVFYRRNRERSSMNYLIKMVLSGASGSIGIKGKHKFWQQYKKERKQRNLPPVDYK